MPAAAQELKPDAEDGERRAGGPLVRPPGQWWVGEVEKRTGDKIKVQIFGSSRRQVEGRAAGDPVGRRRPRLGEQHVFPRPVPGYLCSTTSSTSATTMSQRCSSRSTRWTTSPNLRASSPRPTSYLSIRRNQPARTDDTRPRSSRSRTSGQVAAYLWRRAHAVLHQHRRQPDLHVLRRHVRGDEPRHGGRSAYGDRAANAFKHYEVEGGVQQRSAEVNGNGGALASGFYMSQKKFNALPKDTRRCSRFCARVRHPLRKPLNDGLYPQGVGDQVKLGSSTPCPSAIHPGGRQRGQRATAEEAGGRRPQGRAQHLGHYLKARQNTRPSARQSSCFCNTDSQDVHLALRAGAPSLK